MKLLYINACVRKDSRTKKLADYLVKKLEANVEQVNLIDCNLSALTAKDIEQRNRFISAQKYDEPLFALARQFASADVLVFAAPYWDLSFPALLKLYVEHVNVVPIVFQYSDQGKVISNCKAKKLFYVTTKGGFGSDEYGYGYLKALSETLYGISETYLIKAEGLDIQGNDAEEIIHQTQEKINLLLADVS